MNYIKITKNDIANGPGVRVVLWVSGCTCVCKGCHNFETWDFNSGQKFTADSREELMEALDKPWISGLTLSGGHPLEKQNIGTVYSIINEVKKRFPDKTIWLYTGWEWENIKDFSIMKYIDVLVDGRFIEEYKNITLSYCGSSNQRVIDVKKSLLKNEVVLWEGGDEI